ncbi:MAG TPA: outer membrane beta-barrel protein [Kofleriaceae bacterium]|nr:outer membrane beta-barrel protein [Kofleriaceae bacterium]
MTRLALLLVLAMSAAAHAQGAPLPPPPPPPGGASAVFAAAPGPGTIWIGGALGFLPKGSFDTGVTGGETVSGALATAYSLNAIAELQITRMIAVGVMPRYVLNVLESDAPSGSDSSSMLDLRARVSAGVDVAPQIRVFAFATVGYSIIYPPSSAMTTDNSSGLTVGGGGGAAYALNPRFRAFGEIGYEVGFQSVSDNGTTTDAKAQFLEVNLGVQAAFGG